jgi:ribosomal protein L11 methyltransferase
MNEGVTVGVIEIKLTARASRFVDFDQVRIVLDSLGIGAQRIVEKIQRGKTALLLYESRQSRANAVVRSIKTAKIPGLVVSAKLLRDTDWTTRWKKYFRPFNITDDVRIIPQWMRHSRIPSGMVPVYLDTTFAFGSGMHATTQLVARFMAQHRESLATFLDIGTGSGILALIAHAYGVRHIRALDIDPVAVATARQNCRLNACTPQYLKAVSFEAFKTNKQFSFVAANLLTEDLIRLQDTLAMVVAPGGFLAVSGIFQDNYPLFKRKFSPAGLRCVRVVSRKKWYAVLFKKQTG